MKLAVLRFFARFRWFDTEIEAEDMAAFYQDETDLDEALSETHRDLNKKLRNGEVGQDRLNQALEDLLNGRLKKDHDRRRE